MRTVVLMLVVAGALAAAAPAAERAVGGHSPGWDDYPYAWSPNGDSLLYGRYWQPPKDPSDSGIGVVDLTGPTAHLLGAPFDDDIEAQPAWSPDSQHIVFIRVAGDGEGLVDIFLAGADGRGQRNLTNTPDASEFDPRWSPDGAEIVFSRAVGDAAPDIWAMQPDGTGQHMLAANGRGAQWSPDGTHLIFLRSAGDAYERWIMAADGTGALRLFANEDPYDFPLWSPDSRRIAYSPAGTSDIWAVNADGTGKRRVTAIGKEGGFALEWSPSGAALLVERSTDNGKPTLSLVNATTGADHRLTDGSDGSFSPDGQSIAFDRGVVAGDRTPTAIYVMGADGTGVRRIARGLGGPGWSPNGTRIAASGSAPCLGSGVFVVAVSTATAHRITNDCRITGTNGADRLNGTSETDVIHGLGGNDVIDANPGDRPNVYYGRLDDDLVDAGAGNDVVYARRGTDVVYGGPGNDELFGGAGADRLFGGPGNDVLDGGRYYDRLSGGPGNDAIHARDGFKDTISCGPGVDTVQADRSDIVARDCEHVHRS